MSLAGDCRQGAEGGWGDAAFRGGFVGGGDPQYDVFFAGLGAEDQGEGEAGGRQGGRGVGGDRNITRAHGVERKNRLVDGRGVPRRDQELGPAALVPVDRFRVPLLGASARADVATVP